MNQILLDKIESEQYRKEPLVFAVGDTVRVHTKVVEGDKERIQIFAGVVIGRRGHGLNSTFTVRRISYGEGVERIFPEHSPRVEKVEVERKGAVPPRETDLPAPAHRQERHIWSRKRKAASPRRRQRRSRKLPRRPRSASTAPAAAAAPQTATPSPAPAATPVAPAAPATSK